MPQAEDFGKAFTIAGSTEMPHDPDLDEAVIAFANADFEQCEQALASLTSLSGSRSQHAETWLVLFDLYRATGQQHKFESLAMDYAQQFGWSAPQWFSMPKMVAEAASEERPSSARIDGQVGWVAPSYLDADSVAKLASLAPADAAALGLRLEQARDDRRRSRCPALRGLPQLDPAGSRHPVAVAASASSPFCRTPRRRACATPIRRSGSFASTRCA